MRRSARERVVTRSEPAHDLARCKTASSRSSVPRVVNWSCRPGPSSTGGESSSFALSAGRDAAGELHGRAGPLPAGGLRRASPGEEPPGRTAVLDLVHCLVRLLTVKRLNIHEAKTHLSRELALLAPGDVIVICKNNEPVAELRALPKRLDRRRPWGIDRGVFEVPPDINAELPPGELEAWER